MAAPVITDPVTENIPSRHTRQRASDEENIRKLRGRYFVPAANSRWVSPASRILCLSPVLSTRLPHTDRHCGLLLFMGSSHTLDDAELRFVRRECDASLKIKIEAPHPPARSLHQRVPIPLVRVPVFDATCGALLLAHEAAAATHRDAPPTARQLRRSRRRRKHEQLVVDRSVHVDLLNRHVVSLPAHLVARREAMTDLAPLAHDHLVGVPNPEQNWATAHDVRKRRWFVSNGDDVAAILVADEFRSVDVFRDVMEQK